MASQRCSGKQEVLKKTRNCLYCGNSLSCNRSVPCSMCKKKDVLCYYPQRLKANCSITRPDGYRKLLKLYPYRGTAPLNRSWKNSFVGKGVLALPITAGHWRSYHYTDNKEPNYIFFKKEVPVDLPSSDLLNGIHYFVAGLMEKNERYNSFYKVLRGDTLLGLGVLLEEYLKYMWQPGYPKVNRIENTASHLGSKEVHDLENGSICEVKQKQSSDKMETEKKASKRLKLF